MDPILHGPGVDLMPVPELLFGDAVPVMQLLDQREREILRDQCGQILKNHRILRYLIPPADGLAQRIKGLIQELLRGSGRMIAVNILGHGIDENPKGRDRIPTAAGIREVIPEPAEKRSPVFGVFGKQVRHNGGMLLLRRLQHFDDTVVSVSFVVRLHKLTAKKSNIRK